MKTIQAAHHFLDSLCKEIDYDDRLTKSDAQSGGVQYAVLMPRARYCPHGELFTKRLATLATIAGVPVAGGATRDEAMSALAEKMAGITIHNRRDYVSWAFDMLCARYDTPARGCFSVAARGYETVINIRTVSELIQSINPKDASYVKHSVVVKLLSSKDGHNHRHVSYVDFGDMVIDDLDTARELAKNDDYPLALSDFRASALDKLLSKMKFAEFTPGWLQTVVAAYHEANAK